MELKLVLLLVFSVFIVQKCVCIDNELFGDNETEVIETTERGTSNILSVTLPGSIGIRKDNAGIKKLELRDNTRSPSPINGKFY